MLDPLIHTIKKDKNLERSVLCEISMCRYIHPDLKPDYFTGSEKDLFNAFLRQWNEKKEIDLELLKEIHSETIENVLNAQGTSSESAIDKLRDMWFGRQRGQLMIDCDRIEDNEEALRTIQRIAGESLIVKGGKEYNHEECMNILLTQLEKAALQDKTIRGTSISISCIDETISGIEIPMFYVLGALKKTGKSRLMMHMACQLETNGLGIAINSLEMTPLQLNACALAHFSGIDQSNLGRLKHGETQNIFSNAIATMSNMNITYTHEYFVKDLWSRIDYMKSKRKIDVVFVDFLQRLKDDRYKGDRVREVESVSQALANMSRELNISIVALSQLSGAAEKLEPEIVPDMSYLKESQAIAENADCIMMLHNPKRHDTPLIEMNGVTTYECQRYKMLIEQRYGLTGREVEFNGDLRCCRFWD